MEKSKVKKKTTPLVSDYGLDESSVHFSCKKPENNYYKLSGQLVSDAPT